MSGYKVGGVAALFSQPKEPASESGKKLQSLFKEFHKKNYKNYARSSERNTEEIENNVEQGNGKTESQGIPTNKKKRKFSAVSTESNVEDCSLKKFKKTKKQGENKPAKYNEKQHFLAEQSFPRKKKLSKAESRNLNNDNFEALNINEAVFASNEEVSDTIFKPKDKKKAPSFIKKAKQQKLAATNGNIKKKDNEKISNIEAETNATLFKDESEKFTKRKDKKTKKKRFCDDNLIQNTESDHTDQNLFDESQDSKKYTETPEEESPGSDTSLKREVKDFIRSAKKKSFGGNHKQNLQPKLDAEGEPDFKVPCLNSKDYEDRLRRTLFVGNLPLNTKRKALRTLFSPFGQIEQIRCHGIETDKAKIFSEDGSKTLNPNNFAAHSVPGFIVFVERQSAVNALSLSGSLFKGNHITVDFALAAGSKKLYDDKRSIFMGNLPFDCKDESVWDAFSECGRIECVRIVRDKKTGIGKGFGYVQFSTVQAKENAMALEDVDIQGRSIRIKAIESNKPKQKNINNSPLPAKQRDTFKSRAINIKKKNKDSGSRKSVRKLMEKQKRLHDKKKVANILKKSMKL